MSHVTFKGQPISVDGQFPAVGSTAPAFTSRIGAWLARATCASAAVPAAIACAAIAVGWDAPSETPGSPTP